MRAALIAMAAKIYKVSVNEVTPAMIKDARCVAFGVNYGTPSNSFNEAVRKNPVKDEGKKETP